MQQHLEHTAVAAIRKLQQGGVLVFGLVLLLILTILGTAGSQVSNMELRMASNALDKTRSFQEAEDARIAAEIAASNAAATLRVGGRFDCAIRGFFAASSPPPPTPPQDTVNCAGLAAVFAGDDIRNLNWNAQSATVDGNSDRYIVEYLGVQRWVPPTDPNRGTALEGPPFNAYVFRLTVRGLGVDGGLTYVQSVFVQF